jgi:hypothetical protein
MTLVSLQGWGTARRDDHHRGVPRSAPGLFEPYSSVRGDAAEGETGQAERKALTSRAELARLAKRTRYAAADEKAAPCRDDTLRSRPGDGMRDQRRE